MVKRDPDDLITATSKNLKKENTQTMRITFKRGGEYHKLFAKAHSRIARRQLKTEIGKKSNENQGETCPLYVRYKEGVEGKQTKENRDERIRLNAQVKVGKGDEFISSLLGVFRVNFFKKKEEEAKKGKSSATKADPNSKTSLRKIEKNKRNKERRSCRNEIKKQEKQRQKNIKKQKKQALNQLITSEQ